MGLRPAIGNIGHTLFFQMVAIHGKTTCNFLQLTVALLQLLVCLISGCSVVLRCTEEGLAAFAAPLLLQFGTIIM